MGFCVCWVPSGSVGDGFVFLQAGPLSCRIVHFEDRVDQHGRAAGAVGFGQNLRVLAQLDLDDVPLLRTRVLCTENGSHLAPNGKYESSGMKLRFKADAVMALGSSSKVSAIFDVKQSINQVDCHTENRK